MKDKKNIIDAGDIAQDAAAKIKVGPEERELLKNSFPSNSHKKKEEPKEDIKKVNKVITGKVVTKKQSMGKKFIKNFISDDIDNVGDYILHEVLLPAAKDTVYDLVRSGIDVLKNGLEVALLGDRRAPRSRRDRDRSYVSYNSYSSRRDDRDRDRDKDRDRSSKNRARHNFDDIVLETRGEAEEVLSHLVDFTIDYGQASVSDLYDLVGITGNFTDNKYGWEDLSKASVSRTRDGYVLNLPRTIVLE